jgi:hypothetical protein
MSAIRPGRVPRYRKVFVLAPANSVTGGPEALHQLVDAIRKLGGEAYVSYCPFDSNAEVPEPYRCYDVSAAAPEDETGNLIVMPEGMPFPAKPFTKAATALWWLSVDNFFLVQKDQNWDELRKRQHFAQSAYAAQFLAARGVTAIPLTDYLHVSFAEEPPEGTRRNAIAYHIKSAPVVGWLRRFFPPLRAFNWIRIEDMTRAEVQALLSNVKIFVDFGSHPGRDRMPREAALCGACVLIGYRGSAKMEADVPIPARYKLDERKVGFVISFVWAVLSIFRSYPGHFGAFEGYRRFVRNGRAVFLGEVEREFFS